MQQGWKKGKKRLWVILWAMSYYYIFIHALSYVYRAYFASTLRLELCACSWFHDQITLRGEPFNMDFSSDFDFKHPIEESDFEFFW